MSILTRGLGSASIGNDSVSIVAGQRVPMWSPSKILTFGMANLGPLTAHYPYHNTPVMGFYSAPKNESDTYDLQFGAQAVTTTLNYGKVVSDSTSVPVGAPIEVDRMRDFNGNYTSILASPRPYRNYGTTFQTAVSGLVNQSDYTVKPMGLGRVASAGDLEYATMTPEAHNPYNARSVQIVFPRDVVLGPRSVQRLKLFLLKTKELGVNLRVKKDGKDGPVLIELLDAKTNLKVLQKAIGKFLVKEEVVNRFDILSYQIYSGME